MKNNFLAVAAAAIFLVSANPVPAQAVQTGNVVTVVNIAVHPNGDFDAQFSLNICNDTGAAMNWGGAKLSYPGYTVEGLRSLLTTLQAAKLSGSPVFIKTSGFNWACKITGLELR